MQRRRRYPGQLLGGQGNQRLCTGIPDGQPRDPPDEREHHAFDQHLPHQAPLPGPEARADRELPSTPAGAHEQQVGNVRAGDEQHEQHPCLQHEERLAGIPDELLAYRAGEAGKAARFQEVGRRQTFHVARNDSLELRVHLVERGSRTEPGNHLAELVAPAGIRHLLRREGKRDERGDLTARQLEIGRQHSGHRICLTVHPHVAPDDGGVAPEA